MKKNQILSLVLSIMMLVTVVFPTGVFAEEIAVQEAPIAVVEAADDNGADQAAEVEAASNAADQSAAADAVNAPADQGGDDEVVDTTEDQGAVDEATDATEEQGADEEEASFVQGYVLMNSGASLYLTESTNEKVGAFNGSAIVYAIETIHAENEGDSWLWIVFDTEEARNANIAPFCGYVQFKDVTVMANEAVVEMVNALAGDETVRCYQSNPLPLVDFAIDAEVQQPQDGSLTQESGSATATAPVITSQPQSVTAVKGTKATFRVKATGSGTLSYTWQYKTATGTNWATTKASVTDTLTVSANTNNGYQYRCIVKDDNGSVTSDPATLTVKTVVITTQPKSVTAAKGTKATFTVKATGSGTLSYTWQYKTATGTNWATTKASVTDTLTVTANTNNGYQYRCIVKDSNGSVTSNAATLKVTTLSITKQPQSVTALKGTKASFTVEATGSGTLSYTWQYKTATGTTWATTGASKTNTLTVTANTNNGYQYRCIVKDDNSSVTSNAATLKVTTLSITKQPQSVTALKGTKASFTVEATGSGTLSYTWQYKTATGTTWATTGASTTNTLTVTANANNGYQYRCIVKDSNGSVTSNAATLTVSILTITSQPQSVTAMKGAKASFTVNATGSGTLSYTWQYKTATGTTWATTDASKTKTLTVTANTNNGYQYRCIVKDANSSVTSAAATLTVKTVEITSQPQSVTAKKGTKATFTVGATGSGTLTYTWQYKTATGTTWATTGASTTNTLTVTANANHGYQYRCIVKSGTESVTSDPATLTVSILTITAQPESVTAMKGTKAAFTVNATGRGTLSYTWQYKTATGTTWATTGASKTNTLTVTANTNNGYQYRCIVKDDNGTETSEPATLTVTSITITAQPQDVTARKGTQATFTVEAVGADTLTYTWQYKTATGTTWATTGASTTNTLTVTANTNNGNQYRCIVKCGSESVTSDPATLTVDTVLVSGDITYEILTTTTCSVTSYAGTATSLVIPQTVEDLTVTEVGEEAFMDNKRLVSIDLPDTITVIHARAFKNCSSLSEMN